MGVDERETKVDFSVGVAGRSVKLRLDEFCFVNVS